MKTPNNQILSSYGFKEDLELNGTYIAQFTITHTATLYFTEGGLISIYEEFIDMDINNCRVNKLLINNNEELATILRQTFYLPVHKP